MKAQFKVKLKLDFWSVGLAVCLSIIGILFIYSSSFNKMHNTRYLKQIINLSISLVVYMLIANLSYKRYSSKGIVIYFTGLIFLAITLIFGSSINNSKSWIKLGFFSIQLSEFSKLFFIIAFAVFLNNYQNYVKKTWFLLVSFVIVLPYLGFIILQPDMGTVLAFIFIFFVMLYIGGCNGTYLAVIISVGIIAVLIPFISYYMVHILKMQSFIAKVLDEKISLAIIAFCFLALGLISFLLFRSFRIKKLFYIFIIFLTFGLGFMGANAIKLVFKKYHYERLLIFVDPNMDKKDKGYNIKQSFISIGSGKLTGQGLTKGKQNRGNFLPEEDTDFIIALVGEEWGFLGVSLIILLYLFLIYRCLYIAFSARDLIGSLLAVGISAMYVGHVMINIFSASGLFPVIGVPLPFISYGGSSLLTNFIGLGILFNIKMRRFSYSE